MDGYRVDGDKLRALREKHGFHRRELHKKGRVSLTYLKEIEAGQRQPGVVIVNRICNALGVDKLEFCDPVEDDTADVA